jgi:hypothetical protein
MGPSHGHIAELADGLAAAADVDGVALVAREWIRPYLPGVESLQLTLACSEEISWIVLRPLIASMATLALNPALCVRRLLKSI